MVHPRLPSVGTKVLLTVLLACRRVCQVEALDPSEHHFQRLTLELNFLLQLLSILPR
jgi:hypothetical protein